MRRSTIVTHLVAVLAALTLPITAGAHITGWIAINNDAGTTTNTITDVGNSTIFGGVEAYQSLASFPTVTLADGQYVQLNGTFQALGRTASSAATLERLRDQIRVGLFRAPAADSLQAQNLTGYIIEHRNEMREIQTPVGAPAAGQSPFVSGRSVLINADTAGTSTGSYSTASPPGVSGGNPDAAEFTEEDLVTGVDVTLTIQYRIARDGNNLDITGSIAGSPVSVPPLGATPPTDSDGAFLENFSALNYAPLIDLNDVAGTDNFDFKFNRIGLLMGGNIDLEVAPFAGDYDGNNVVDMADYVVWRDNNNTAATLPNDSTPGVDDTDYPVWAANFGRKVGTIVLSNVEITNGTVGSSSLFATVPEPATLVLLVMAAMAVGCARRTR